MGSGFTIGTRSVAVMVAWSLRNIDGFKVNCITFFGCMREQVLKRENPTGGSVSRQSGAGVAGASVVRHDSRGLNAGQPKQIRLADEFKRATEILYDNDSISCLVMNVGGFQVAVQRTQSCSSAHPFAYPVNPSNPVMAPVAPPETSPLVEKNTDEAAPAVNSSVDNQSEPKSANCDKPGSPTGCASQKRQSGSAKQSPDNNTGEQTSTNDSSPSIAADDEQVDILDLIGKTKGRWVSQNEFLDSGVNANRHKFTMRTLRAGREGDSIKWSTKNPAIGRDGLGNFLERTGNCQYSYRYRYFLLHEFDKTITSQTSDGK